MSNTKTRPLAEEALERAIQVLDGPMNERVERLMKSRLLLAPAGLFLTLTARSWIALRDMNPRALLGERRERKDGGR